MKLNLGCGVHLQPGYVNVDVRGSTNADLVCDALDLPYPDEQADIIETYHMFEHLTLEDARRALREWWRVLKQGGRLIVECPNFDWVVAYYLAGHDDVLSSIFGAQRFPYDVHQWGWNCERFSALLRETGFREVECLEAQDYHAWENPQSCLRVETVK